MEISEEYVGYIKFLFESASIAVNLNGSPDNMFKIERGVRQSCSFAPYLFLIVGEVLTQIIKKAMSKGKLEGSLYRGK